MWVSTLCGGFVNLDVAALIYSKSSRESLGHSTPTFDPTPEYWTVTAVLPDGREVVLEEADTLDRAASFIAGLLGEKLKI